MRFRLASFLTILALVAFTGSSCDVDAHGPNVIAGIWESVDFVANPEDFQPGTRATRTELYLENLSVFEDGRTSTGYTLADGWMTHSSGEYRAEYYVKTFDGDTYLFFPWMSGDVTIRGMAPKYYVLKWAGPIRLAE